MKIVLLVTASVCLLATAFFAHAQDLPADKGKLQGTWKVVSVMYRPNVDTLFLGKLIKFDGESMLTYDEAVRDDRLLSKGSITVDATKTPKQIDIYGYPNGKKTAIPLLGIYAFDGDKLRLSWSGRDGKDRPLTFDRDPNDKKSKQFSLILERIQEKKN